MSIIRSMCKVLRNEIDSIKLVVISYHKLAIKWSAYLLSCPQSHFDKTILEKIPPSVSLHSPPVQQDTVLFSLFKILLFLMTDKHNRPASKHTGCFTGLLVPTSQHTCIQDQRLQICSCSSADRNGEQTPIAATRDRR